MFDVNYLHNCILNNNIFNENSDTLYHDNENYIYDYIYNIYIPIINQKKTVREYSKKKIDKINKQNEKKIKIKKDYIEALYNNDFYKIIELTSYVKMYNIKDTLNNMFYSYVYTTMIKENIFNELIYNYILKEIDKNYFNNYSGILLTETFEHNNKEAMKWLLKQKEEYEENYIIKCYLICLCNNNYENFILLNEYYNFRNIKINNKDLIRKYYLYIIKYIPKKYYRYNYKGIINIHHLNILDLLITNLVIEYNNYLFLNWFIENNIKFNIRFDNDIIMRHIYKNRNDTLIKMIYEYVYNNEEEYTKYLYIILLNRLIILPNEILNIIKFINKNIS